MSKDVLTKVELETILLEVEACVNSRPLTFVSDEFDSSRPLTPSHFLTGRWRVCIYPWLMIQAIFQSPLLLRGSFSARVCWQSSGVCGRLIILGTCRIL